MLLSGMYFTNSNVNFGILNSKPNDFSGSSHAISVKETEITLILRTNILMRFLLCRYIGDNDGCLLVMHVNGSTIYIKDQEGVCFLCVYLWKAA